jgi:hypothetical protein
MPPRRLPSGATGRVPRAAVHSRPIAARCHRSLRAAGLPQRSGTPARAEGRPLPARVPERPIGHVTENPHTSWRPGHKRSIHGHASFRNSTERISPDPSRQAEHTNHVGMVRLCDVCSNDPPCLDKAVEIQRPDMDWLARLGSFHDLAVPDVNDDMIHWLIEKEQVARL